MSSIVRTGNLKVSTFFLRTPTPWQKARHFPAWAFDHVIVDIEVVDITFNSSTTSQSLVTSNVSRTEHSG